MSYIGITPSEDSSGLRRRQGGITKTGNEACRRAIIEAAWQYRLPARVTPHIRKRHHGQPKAVVDIAWKAQTRLCERYQTLLRHRKKTVVVVTAIGRELVGFLWAIAREIDQPGAAAAEALEKKNREALNGKTGDAKETGSTPKPLAKVARSYQLDAGKKHEPVRKKAGKKAGAGKAFNKKQDKQAAAAR